MSCDRQSLKSRFFLYSMGPRIIGKKRVGPLLPLQNFQTIEFHCVSDDGRQCRKKRTKGNNKIYKNDHNDIDQNIGRVSVECVGRPPPSPQLSFTFLAFF